MHLQKRRPAAVHTDQGGGRLRTPPCAWKGLTEGVSRAQSTERRRQGTKRQLQCSGKLRCWRARGIQWNEVRGTVAGGWA